MFYQYVLRAKELWRELNIPEDREFSVLDNYNENWLDLSFEIEKQKLIDLLNNDTAPTFCFYKINNKYKVFVNKTNWENIDKSNTRNEDFNKLLDLSNEENIIVLVWSAIDSYEVLNKKDSKERLKELGIKLEV